MMRQVKEIMYVANNAETANEPMALNAAVEPMLIRAKRLVITNVRMTAFRGIFHPGLT